MKEDKEIKLLFLSSYLESIIHDAKHYEEFIEALYSKAKSRSAVYSYEILELMEAYHLIEK